MSIASVATTKTIASKFLQKSRVQHKPESHIDTAPPSTRPPTAAATAAEADRMAIPIPRTSSSLRGNSCSAERLLVLALDRAADPEPVTRRHAVREIAAHAVRWRGLRPRVVATLAGLLLDPAASTDAGQARPARRLPQPARPTVRGPGQKPASDISPGAARVDMPTRIYCLGSGPLQAAHLMLPGWMCGGGPGLRLGYPGSPLQVDCLTELSRIDESMRAVAPRRPGAAVGPAPVTARHCDHVPL